MNAQHAHALAAENKHFFSSAHTQNHHPHHPHAVHNLLSVDREEVFAVLRTAAANGVALLERRAVGGTPARIFHEKLPICRKTHTCEHSDYSMTCTLCVYVVFESVHF